MLSIATLFVVSFSVPALPGERGKFSLSNEFVNTLRRQITRDNYDYSDGDLHKKDTSLQMRANSKHEAFRDNEERARKSHQSKMVTKYNFYIPTLARDNERKGKDVRFENKKSKQVEHVVSNRDLLYYIDDRELLPEQNQPFQNKQGRVKQKWSSATKYKILKLKRQYRRQNKPRLIEEESMGTVAIVNLDGGPIPQVRLPPSRRQYMRDRGEIMGDEDEVPPPPINSSDPEAAPDDAFSKTNLTIVTEIIK